jgi:GH15 family glucan-1,4-alpha-glucosidase
VCRDGSVDWLCWPRFDSDACFAALLGGAENGRWIIAPEGPSVVKRRYAKNTLILETDHVTQSGTVRVIDFMPMRTQGATLIRIIKGVCGKVPMHMELSPRSNYGAVAPWFELEGQAYIGRVGACEFTASGTLGMRVEQGVITAKFDVSEGEMQHIMLRYTEAGTSSQAELADPLQALAETERFWRRWIAGFDKATDWPDAVRRSLITLKALIYRPSGGLVAAPTTSLPEAPGGKLNWDYRFSWIRDATFTLCALLNAGFHAEAKAWRDWILRTVGTEPHKLRIMYRINGDRHIPEWEVDWLDGYNHARPVRIGNGASTQHQADVYGELLDAMHLASQAGIARTPHSIEIETKIVEHIELTWREPGAGLWESRGEPRHYVYSRVMAWAGVDRFLDAAETRDYAGPERVGRWNALRATIHAEICREGFHPGLDRFVEYYGGQTIDACLLLLPLVNFLPIDDPRIIATVAAIERELVEDGLVRRKKSQGNEPQGAFIACTLWLADCQNLQGRCADARKTLERVLAVRNDLGLLSEEYNVAGKHLAGNFPQALSHLALVNTALGLCGPVLQRGGG